MAAMRSARHFDAESLDPALVETRMPVKRSFEPTELFQNDSIAIGGHGATVRRCERSPSSKELF
ncbi:MAG: hypothetical protein LWW93_08790 [Hyphomicrobiales bacterium]|nr:hypothetical protein [Hyphomicrobiales bacterium]